MLFVASLLHQDEVLHSCSRNCRLCRPLDFGFPPIWLGLFFSHADELGVRVRYGNGVLGLFVRHADLDVKLHVDELGLSVRHVDLDFKLHLDELGLSVRHVDPDVKLPVDELG